MSAESKCPFTGVGTPSKFPTGRGTSNRDWWPNSLNLKILSSFILFPNTFSINFCDFGPCTAKVSIFDSLIFTFNTFIESSRRK